MNNGGTLASMGIDQLFYTGTNVITVASNQLGAQTINAVNGSTAVPVFTLAASGTLNVSSLVTTQIAAGSYLSATGVATTGAGVAVTAYTLNGSTGADTITGSTTLADTITGGTGADTMTGGGTVANTFVFAAGASGAPSSTNFDTITDFTAVAANVISRGAQLVLGSTANAGGAVAGSAKIGNANGVAAVFHADDNTLALKIVAVEAGLSGATNTNHEVAIFVDSGSTYVFIADGVAGVGANDVLIKLTGVTGTDTAFDVATLVGETLTLA
jgi:S-layer protein